MKIAEIWNIKLNVNFRPMNNYCLRKKIRIILIVLLGIYLPGCSQSKKISIRNSYPFEISFGQTGGFTNMNPVFIVKNSGEVLKKETAASTPVMLKKIKMSQIDSLYAYLEDSGFSTLTIAHPSNITNFIDIQSEKGKNKITWSDEAQIPDKVKKLNRYLLSIVKK